MNALPDFHAPRALTGPTILHPTEFAPDGASALAHAVALAMRTQGRLTLLHIRPAGDTGPVRSGLAAVTELLARWRRLGADERFADLPTRLGFSATCIAVPAHSVASGVLDHFAEHLFELAVLTTRAHSGLSYWFAGSTSRRALRQASSMILFLREGRRGFVDPQTGQITLRRALIALDGRIPPAGPIARTKALIDRLGVSVELRLLHVGAAPPADCPKDIPLALAQGPVAETILKTAEATRADLIVMPTAGKRGLLAAFRNSVSAEILDDARWPVLSVPAT
jgi:nucleotide-binding universal stress UspA family protein